ncbi:MAG: response regulator [Candidatus Gribaldobacteria bacterium]|nr:response regulator [Candidatus Gribaldobacteria bacterium]
MKNILLIEDEEIMSGLLQKKLSDVGYKVTVARDGEEGINLLKQEKPDLVLTDIVMPKKDGFEVLEAMKADPQLSNIPVIVISNSGQPVELERVKHLGARDWLIKTEFDPKEVIEKIKKIIG